MLFTSNFTRRFMLAQLFVMISFCGTLHLSAQTNSPASMPEQTPSAAPAASVLIRWRARPNVSRYRLQFAHDNAFEDIVLDRAVFSNTYQVTELPPGRYYWRVAPATTETERYTTVGVVTISQAESAPLQTESTAAQTEPDVSRAELTPPLAIVSPAPREALLAPTLNTGWNAAIGDAVSFAMAEFDSTSPLTILAINAEGTIYSLDARRGVALWTARFDPAQKSGERVDREQVGEFTPLVVASRRTQGAGRSSTDRKGIVVAFSEGVRLIEASSGREVWRASIGGRPLAGVIADTGVNGESEVIVATRNPDRLYFINNRSGSVRRRETLDGTTVGAPLVLRGVQGSEVLLAFDNGRLVVFNSRDTARSIKLDTRITTPPLLAESAAGARLLVGTERGLVALQLPDMQPVWRIATEGEPPRGVLVSADLDGDQNLEAVMVTRNNRVAVIDVERGVIKWVAEGATNAAVAALADVNDDGTLDVIVAANDTFAVGYSGRDGRLVWSTEEDVMPRAAQDSAGASSLRALMVVPLRDENGAINGAVLVGADPLRVGLRAVRLTRNALTGGRR